MKTITTTTNVFEITELTGSALEKAINQIQERRTDDADEELEQQGLTLDEITKMSLNRYGNVIETLAAPDSGTYWVFVGSR